MILQFSNTRRSAITKSTEDNNNSASTASFMPFTTSNRNYKVHEEAERRRIAAAATNPSSSSPSPSVAPRVASSQERPKTMKWGEPTWYLLHTLAQKVKEDQFPRMRKEFLDIILKICINLPCPDCANHATRYMQGVNFDTITTKQQLKDLLFRFHNTVNAKKGFPQFSYQDLDSKYSSAVTSNIILYFIQHFEKNNYSLRVGTSGFYRSRSVSAIKQWIFSNLQGFNP